MTSVIALVPAPVDRYPLWRWLPDAEVRAIVDAEPSAPPVPVPHERVREGDRSAQVRRHLSRMCTQQLPDRIVYLASHDLLRAAVARTLHGVSGQSLSAASVFADRVLLRERVASAGVPVIPYAAVDQPVSVLRFAQEHGYPVAVRPRFLQQPRAQVAVLSTPAQVRAWSDAGYRDDPQGWIVESAAAGRQVRVDALHRGLPLEMVWVGSSVQVPPGRSGSPLLTLPLGSRESPGAAAALRTLAAALAALPDPGTCLVTAQLRESAAGLAVADLSCGVDDEYPRTVIEAAYGQDPVIRYVRAACESALVPVADRPIRVAGRIAIPARRARLAHIDQLPEQFTGTNTRVQLAEPGGALAEGGYAAVLTAHGPTLPDVRRQLHSFADWAEDALHYAASVRAAA